VAGGAESACNRIGIAGFAACKALATAYNDNPKAASRPYDRDRDGFVMGEGAGCVVLESLEHAQARGARIYAEVIGYGMSGDAYHITAPREDGDGAFRCMQAAIKRAESRPPTSTTSMRTAPRPWPTASNWRRSSGGRRRGFHHFQCPRPNPRRPSARRGGRGRGDFLYSGHFAIKSRRPRSISIILQSKQRLISFRTSARPQD